MGKKSKTVPAKTRRPSPTAKRANGAAASAADSNQLTALEWQALAAAAGRDCKATRNQVVEGRGQLVDVTVRISGAVDVSKSAAAKAQTKPSAVEVFAAVLAHFPRDDRDKLCADVEKMILGKTGKLVTSEVASMATGLIDRCTRTGQKIKRGAVSGALSVEVLERNRRAING